MGVVVPIEKCSFGTDIGNLFQAAELNNYTAVPENCLMRPDFNDVLAKTLTNFMNDEPLPKVDNLYSGPKDHKAIWQNPRRFVISEFWVSLKFAKVLLLLKPYSPCQDVEYPNLKILFIESIYSLEYITAPKLEHIYCEGGCNIRLKKKFPNVTLHIYKPHIRNGDYDVPCEYLSERQTIKGWIVDFMRATFNYELNHKKQPTKIANSLYQ